MASDRFKKLQTELLGKPLEEADPSNPADADKSLLDPIQPTTTIDAAHYDPSKDETNDPVPYDPNSGTLTNVGRFMANNAATDPGYSGMMPVAGSVKAAKAAAQLAEEEAPALTQSGLFQKLVKKLSPSAEEAAAQKLTGPGYLYDEPLKESVAVRDALYDSTAGIPDSVSLATQKANNLFDRQKKLKQGIADMLAKKRAK